MKTKDKDAKVFTIVMLIALIAAIAMFFCTEASAQTKNSSWLVEQTFEVPFNAETTTITFDDGTVRNYLVLEDGFEVFIHKSSFEKFKKKERGLILVEWVNTNTGRYKYTTRLAEPEDEQTRVKVTWKSSKSH